MTDLRTELSASYWHKYDIDSGKGRRVRKSERIFSGICRRTEFDSVMILTFSVLIAVTGRISSVIEISVRGRILSLSTTPTSDIDASGSQILEVDSACPSARERAI